jgi:hypothetical protein
MGRSRMDRVAPGQPDKTRTFVKLSGDIPTGQDRTLLYKSVRCPVSEPQTARDCVWAMAGVVTTVASTLAGGSIRWAWHRLYRVKTYESEQGLSQQYPTNALYSPLQARSRAVSGLAFTVCAAERPGHPHDLRWRASTQLLGARTLSGVSPRSRFRNPRPHPCSASRNQRRARLARKCKPTYARVVTPLQRFA